jgi:hypothetical protein
MKQINIANREAVKYTRIYINIYNLIVITCRKIIIHKPEGTQQVGRPAIRQLDSDEEVLKTMGVRNWRRN